MKEEENVEKCLGVKAIYSSRFWLQILAKF